jgi:hypothetical protein
MSRGSQKSSEKRGRFNNPRGKNPDFSALSVPRWQD